MNKAWGGDKWTTALKTRYGHFEYWVMPFRLTNTLAMFQDYINKMMVEKLNVFVIVYLDVIFIYIKNKSEKHVQAIWWVLDQLQKHLLYANLKKCQFYQNEVRFLSYIVSHQGIQLQEKYIKAVWDWPKPQSIRDILVFLGFSNFYQRFIEEFSRLVALLTSMLKTASIAGSANKNAK